MLPTPGALLTVMTPSATIHFAGDLSWADTHSSRFFPSNRTIASEGGALQVAPGVTIFGTGSQTSVSSGFGLACSCAVRGTATAIRAANARSVENCMRMIFKRIHLIARYRRLAHLAGLIFLSRDCRLLRTRSDISIR